MPLSFNTDRVVHLRNSSGNSSEKLHGTSSATKRPKSITFHYLLEALLEQQVACWRSIFRLYRLVFIGI